MTSVTSKTWIILNSFYTRAFEFFDKISRINNKLELILKFISRLKTLFRYTISVGFGTMDTQKFLLCDSDISFLVQFT
ncbi:CLUMA_CG019238, isoform A [Clunio marinus]|uniref:CLUMA_CG019238, isoform A n=1 Tax=Clunio marinus TaxID=568069 RepID=A0A1J1J0W4_9DIPT|nr:CLUMA_CG019238, isoform A [Clunio marinus]